MTRLVHFSYEPIEKLERRPFQGHYREIGKPSGLWVSDESGPNSWSSWCASEEYRKVWEQIAYEVKLKPDANVLWIRSEVEIDLFAEKFRSDYKMSSMSLHGINWDAVAEQHGGVIITPYLWSRRLKEGFMWYYGWDCASGCIWDPECVESLTQIDSTQFKFREKIDDQPHA